MSTKTAIALAALLAAALGAPAAAGQQEGVVVVRDPLTGKLRNATPAEARRLHAQSTARGMVKPEGAAPDVTIRKNGTIQKHLGERGLVYSVVTRDAAGKLDTQCVHGEEAANAALKRQAPATGKEHDHETR
ncbi:MAG: hypothetical protein V4693_06910 [Pseudomonadota bacterium]